MLSLRQTIFTLSSIQSKRRGRGEGLKPETKEMIEGMDLEEIRKHMKEEKDPDGKRAKEPGAKFDEGKAPITRGCLQYFPRALEAVALVSLHGASKYSWKGWEVVPDGINRYGDALGRHLAREAYEAYDIDSSFHHAAHAAWDALARLELILRSGVKLRIEK
jgi:hypothetical protein